MTYTKEMEAYLQAVLGEGLYGNRGNLEYHVRKLFEDMDLHEKKVLDIGGGAGLYSFYAASQGAESVLCLEPEGEGSSSKSIARFRKMQERLHWGNVRLDTATFQAFEASGEAFDVILLYNSINHLDEAACIRLLRDDRALAAYRRIFLKVGALARAGAKLVLCDCSPHNFFAGLGLRNPFAPDIEWHKHHAPGVWVRLLGEAGFVNPKVRWSSFNRLRGMGRILLGHRWTAYFLYSHFRLTMEKPLLSPDPAA